MRTKVFIVPTDVTDYEAVTRLVGEAKNLGHIDVWVSNVGVGAVGRFHETPMDLHEKIIRANLIGHVNEAHAVVPVFLQQGDGVFINMISLGGFAAAPFAAAYSASKFGLRGFSEALRAELADAPGIHVCDIYPAFVDTPGLRHGANYVGREISAPPPLLDPRTVADAIVRVAKEPKPSTMVGVVTPATRLAHLLAPNLSARMLALLMNSYFRRASRVPRSDGNVFHPADPPGGIDGGFGHGGHYGKPVLLALAAVAAMGLGAAAASRSRQRSKPGSPCGPLPAGTFFAALGSVKKTDQTRNGHGRRKKLRTQQPCRVWQFQPDGTAGSRRRAAAHA
ncbi:short-subunit dehydrogenase [Pseudorhizobium tarimense]|uniref:Short-subunit dehydrogenase n=1 Tax=Pseudorhizobium tarimense TaxID=1079109 RepID=A0ABV2H4L4_9HYPH